MREFGFGWRWAGGGRVWMFMDSSLGRWDEDIGLAWLGFACLPRVLTVRSLQISQNGRH